MRKQTIFIIQLIVLNTMLASAIAQYSNSVDSVGQAKISPQRLFHIERNKNPNIAVYDAQVHSNGSLYTEEPIIAYWLMMAEDGRRQELNTIEKKLAYGFKTENASKDSVVMKLSADIGRDLKVLLVEDVYRAVIKIDSVKAYLERIYIMAVEKPPRPKVQYMELFGTDIISGEDLYEKILP
jgi:hypothetical protein